MPIRLDQRLTAIANLVDYGKVADVGCDHGKLGYYLVSTDRASEVIATDISKPSLDKAKELAFENGVADIEITEPLKGFMINEFYRRERRFRYKEEFDTMRYFTPIMKLPRKNGAGYKFPKLTELGEFLDIYPYDVTRKTMELFDSGVSAHDARYDTTALYLCFNEGAKKFDGLQEIASKHLQKDE